MKKKYVLISAVLIGAIVAMNVPPPKPVEAYRDQGGFYTKPAIAEDGTIYVGDRDNAMRALDPNPNAEVREKWFFTTGNIVLSNPAIAPAGTPLRGTIYFGSRDHNFYALNPDGTLQWSYPVEGYGEAGPIIDPVDGTIYVGSMDGYLYAFYPDRPASPLKWSLEMPEKGAKFIPIISHDRTRIYVGSTKGGLYSITNGGKFDKTFGQGGVFDPKDEYRIGGALDAAGNIYTSGHSKIIKLSPKGTELWRFEVDQVHRSHPILSPDEKTVYQGSRDDDYVYALNVNDGSVNWKHYGGINMVATGVVHPLTGVIYIGAAREDFYAINPNGKRKWTFDTNNYGIRSTPTLSHDLETVYIGDERNNFFALNAETGKVIWAYDTRTNADPELLQVDTSTDQTVVLSGGEASVAVIGTISGGAGSPSFKWALVEGPEKAKADFSTPKNISTTITFTEPGEYIIELTVKDGKQTSSTEMAVTVLAEGIPPAPPPAGPPNSKIITVAGKTNDPSNTVTINGVSADMKSDGTFVAVITISEGDTIITAKTTNKYGVSANHSIKAVLKPKPKTSGLSDTSAIANTLGGLQQTLENLLKLLDTLE